LLYTYPSAYTAAAIKDLNPNNEKLNITRRSTLLLDDQYDNVEAAISNGVCGIRFNPDDEDATVDSIVQLFPPQKTSVPIFNP
jgi:hypothetical protein